MGSGDGALGLRKKILKKKKKKSTWKALTFVVYYRIHLNLNLEASARQWLNSVAHPRREKPTLEPQTRWWEFCRLGSLFFFFFNAFRPKTGTGFQRISHSFVHLWALGPERGSFTVVLMVLKPDNVPSSLRDTGCCHSDHAASLQYTRWLPLFEHFRCLFASFFLISSRGTWPSCTEVFLAETQHPFAINMRARKHPSAFFPLPSAPERR